MAQAGRTIVSYAPPDPARVARETRDMYDAWCPGLTDELRGVAEGLNINEERVLFCATVSDTGGCSQAVILPAATEDGHTYTCRVYDFSLEESDRRLCATRVDGCPAHLGYSEMLLGRNEGINGLGLCVTASVPWGAQAPPAPGLHYAIAIRALLEQCGTVSEALGRIAEMPIGSAVNLILIDRRGGRGARGGD